MLELTSPQVPNHRMPVDFTTYLLSSSPPATSVELLGYAFNQHNDFNPAKKCFHTLSMPSLGQRRKAPLKPIIIKSEYSSEGNSTATSENSSPGSSRSTSPVSPGRLKKKVSFADHNGKALAVVRVMTEPSDMPPRLRMEMLATLTQGATAGVTEQPPLKLCFNQPASDYLAFRDKIERECVSLENVILKDYRVGGTIKVKNVAFEKEVSVRVTFDSWESSVDTRANFVAGPGGQSMYDTFSFEFNVPTNYDVSKKIEFAVCYEVNDMQYWDSNGGQNYHIVSSDFTERCCESQAVSVHRRPDWTQFACWNTVDTSTPYW